LTRSRWRIAFTLAGLSVAVFLVAWFILIVFDIAFGGGGA
jgi:hypothetical protein